MSYTPDQLIRITTKFVKLAEDSLGDVADVDVPQPPTFEEDYLRWKERQGKEEPFEAEESDEERSKKWLEEHRRQFLEPVDEMADLPLMLEAAAKKKQKLDPKAKVRNKPSPVVPAGNAKDKKDHFPLGSEDQARNALARVMQYTKVPPWYKGSLQGLQEAVRRKVKSKYPGIEVTTPKKKKSALDSLLYSFGEEVLAKYGQSQTAKQYWIGGRWVNQAPDEVPTGAKMRQFENGAWYTYTMSEEGTWESTGTDSQADPAGTKDPNTISIPTQTVVSPKGQGGGGGPSQYGNPAEQQMIKKIQEYLISQKIPLQYGADGKLGQATQKALAAWKKTVGLTPNGKNELDTDTWNKLAEVIPEIKAFTQAATTVAAPVDLNAARGMVDQARRWLDQMNKAYQAGQMRNPQVAQQFYASIAPFSDPSQGIPAIAQQLNGLVQNPQINPDQKKQIQEMLFNVNDAAMALAQWNQILSGQFAQTGQMPGLGQVVPVQQQQQQGQPGQPPPPPPPPPGR